MRTLVLTLFVFVFALGSEAQVWQQSTSQTYEFGVRDKYGEGKHKVLFSVWIGEEEYRVYRDVIKDEWATAGFPLEFTDAAIPNMGNLKWYGIIDGDTIASDTTFYYATKAVAVYQSFGPALNQFAVEGAVIDAYNWTDYNGKNFLIRTIDNESEAHQATLKVYHYANMGTDMFVLLREITDFVDDCEFDIILGHVNSPIMISDIDANGITEVVTIYRVDCVSDVSPFNLKLMCLTNGEKYAFRGSSYSYGIGGEYTAGKEFEKNQSLKGYCHMIWEYYKEASYY